MIELIRIFNCSLEHKKNKDDVRDVKYFFKMKAIDSNCIKFSHNLFMQPLIPLQLGNKAT